MAATGVAVLPTSKLPLGTKLVRALIPAKAQRLFFITTLFTYLTEKCDAKVGSYKALHAAVKGLTPTEETFELPSLFSEFIWGKTGMSSVNRVIVTHNGLKLDEIISATPCWLMYNDTDAMTQDILLVFRLIQHDLNDAA